MARVLLGACGSIAAIKLPMLIRLLRDRGYEVRVMMTRSAMQFVTPLSLSVLSESPVWTPDQFEPGYVQHIKWANDTDALVVVPASANTVAKMANGLADDPLSTTVLSYNGPVMVVPAMHDSMWLHPATQANVTQLIQRGVRLLGPDTGALSSGDVGIGRLCSPELIADSIDWITGPLPDLTGCRIGVVMGGTREPIDPVRLICNRSTGQLGTAIATGAVMAGGVVSVISTEPIHHPQFKEVVMVETADEMYQAIMSRYPELDVLIMPAAVGDYGVATPSNTKIRKTGKDWLLNLQENVDILSELGRRKTHQRLVGFCLGDGDIVGTAQIKRVQKQCDWMIANDPSQFGSARRSGWVIEEGGVMPYADLTPTELARLILLALAR